MKPNTVHRLLAAVAVTFAGLFPVTAGAAPKASCTIEAFDYTVVSSIVEGRLAYLAEGSAMLSGARCPFSGSTVQVREAVEYAFDATGNVTGRYKAQWSDATGHVALSWHGQVNVSSSNALPGSGSGSFEQVVHAHGPKGAQLRIEQAATIDLNLENPLTGLTCRCGVIAIPIGS